MIALIKDLPENIVGFKYSGEVTDTDYESVLFPTIRNADIKNNHLNILCKIEDDFTGFNLGAMKDDFELGFKYFKDWGKIAVVSEKSWLNHLTQALSFLIPAKVKVFDNQEMDKAITWLTE